MSKRLDLQGLRCLAIIGVLIYHIWPDKCPSGYLGVDIFFVLSGYLMFTILSSRDLTPQTVITFYFRRIRRIFPTYLFVIICTLIGGFYIFVSSAYKLMLTESTTAALFVSNMFNLPERGYFVANNLYALFLHTWSLSVEIQFYVLVPAIFWGQKRLNDKNKMMAMMYMMGICGYSLAYQIRYRYSLNKGHMALLSRIWQFMLGFIAGYSKTIETSKEKNIYHTKYSLLCNDSTLTTISNAYNLPSNYRYVLKDTTMFLIALVLSTDLLVDKNVARIVCALLATIYIYIDEESILNHPMIVYLGDVSYSIYLVHWPIIKLLGYYRETESGNSVEAGFACIFLPILAGCLIEHVFLKINSYIIDWKRLILTLILLYSTIGYLHIYISNTDAHEVSNVPPNAYKPMVRLDPRFVDHVHSIYQNRMYPTNMTRRQTVDFNSESWRYMDVYGGMCKDKMKREFPDHQRNDSFFTLGCTDRGDGEKEMVIVGDSMARDMYPAVKYMFKKYYSRLTLLARPGYRPYFYNSTFSGTNIVRKVLNNWDRQIDVMFIQFNTYRFAKTHEEDYGNTIFPQQFQEFYDYAENLTSETIFLGYPEVPMPELEHLVQYYKFIEKGLPLEKFYVDWSDFTSKSAHYRHVIETLQCKKCLKVDYSKALLNPITGQYLPVLPNGLVTRRDIVHTTLFGSFFYIDAYLDAYKRKYFDFAA